MNERPWLRSLTVVHRLPDRIRLRYRRHPDAPPALALEMATRLLDGVKSARVNERASSLVIEFDPASSDSQRSSTGFRNSRGTS